MEQELQGIIPTTAFIGAGAMGGAIVRGILDSSVEHSGDIRVTGAWTPQLDELAIIDGVHAYDVITEPDANKQAVRGAAVVILAVKPDLIARVLADIGGDLEPGALVVSIAAGITTAAIESALPSNISVVRVMPNTPALVGRGVTGISAGSRASESDLGLVESIFGTVGSVLRVPESQIDAVTSISGSGPAYVFYLIEALTAVAQAKGFTPEQAAILVNGTFRGASELLDSSEKSAGELREQVTSPNGTTAAALGVLQRGDISELFEAATDAALTRAKELAL